MGAGLRKSHSLAPWQSRVLWYFDQCTREAGIRGTYDANKRVSATYNTAAHGNGKRRPPQSKSLLLVARSIAESTYDNTIKLAKSVKKPVSKRYVESAGSTTGGCACTEGGAMSLNC